MACLKYLFCFSIFWLSGFSLSAQRLGLEAGYVYNYIDALDVATKHFNFVHAEQATFSPLRHGFYLNTGYDLSLDRGHQLFLTPSATFWQAEQSTRSFLYPVRAQIRGYEAQVGLDYYAFTDTKEDISSFGHNFFFTLHAGLAWLEHQLFFADLPFQIRGKNYKASVLTPFTQFGAGFDVYIFPTFSLTPQVRIGYMLPFTFKDLSVPYTGGRLLDFPSQSARIYLKFGISARLHAKSTTHR